MQSPLDYFPPRHWWRLVNKSSLRADAWAALTAAIVVLPQAIAFAAIAGLPIEYGFYTAIVTPIIAAIFGSSRQMVSGPTTAISILLFASLSKYFEPGSDAYIQAAITLTLLAGLFQIVLGLLRLGSLANFVSPSVMVGFTAGAAVTIVLSQLPGALGITTLEGDLSLTSAAFLSSINMASVIIATITLVTAAFLAKVAPRLPYYLIAVAVGTFAAWLGKADNFDVSYISAVTNVIPSFALPDFGLDNIRVLAQAAFAIALVGLLEAAAISRSLSIKTSQDVDVNQEFLGQGLSNAIGSFFSAYMGSGSFTRSALNFEAGAKTPLSAILASIFLVLILVFFGQWLELIPVPAIAGLIMLVAFRLLEFGHIRQILQSSQTSSTVMLVTFLATLFIGLEFGIYMGVFVSLAFFLRRSANPYLAMTAPDARSPSRYFKNAPAFKLDECPQLGFARLDGLLYFGSLEGIRAQLRKLENQRPEQTHLIMLMKGVGDIDMPGAHLLVEEASRRIKRGGRLYLTARRRQIKGAYSRLGVIQSIGEEYVFPNKGLAIQHIIPSLDQNICNHCDKRIFKECPAPQG